MRTLLPGYEAIPVRNVTELALTNLMEAQSYYYRIRRRVSEGEFSEWSPMIKLRLGPHMPVFRHLPCESPASKGIVQLFAVGDLVKANGILTASSSDANAVEASVTNQCLVLRYKWKKGSCSAQVGLTVRDPETRFASSYSFTVSKANGPVGISNQSALRTTASGVDQEVILENLTGATLFGVRVRVAGLDRAGWLANRTGRDPVTMDPIVEVPCILQPGSQAVVRLEYNRAYKVQAKTRPAQLFATAILQPARGTSAGMELDSIQAGAYDGMRILSAPALVGRNYGIYCSDDAGESWFMEGAVRATGHGLIWMDDDPEATDNRLYRVVETNAIELVP